MSEQSVTARVIICILKFKNKYIIYFELDCRKNPFHDERKWLSYYCGNNDIYRYNIANYIEFCGEL